MTFRTTGAGTWLCRLLLIVVFLPPLIAGETPGMTLDEIEPGMKCRSLTFFKQDAPENLDVEILGVVQGATTESSYVLARVDSPSVQRGGIMAGMSGSPVFYEDRLIGAIALAFPFSREPVCGITPIGAMRKLYDLNQAGSADSRTHIPRRDMFREPVTGSADRLMPIGLTVQTRGMPPFLTDESFHTSTLQTAPDPRGFDIAVSGGRLGVPPDIRPGSAIGVGLVTGDVSITVFGTVTDVSGDKLLAFGHPMFGLGRCNLPIHVSEVVSFVPSLYVSFKLANPGPPIGTLLFDSEAGVLGEIGPIPPVIPVDISIDGLTSAPLNYHLDVANHEYLSTNLIAQALFGLIRNLGGIPGDLSMRTELSVKLTNGLMLERSGIFGTVENLFDSILTSISVIQQIHQNPFEPVLFEHVNLRCSMTRSTALATLDSLSVTRKKYRPGDTLQVNLGFHGDRMEPCSRTVKLNLPSDIPPGKYILKVLDATAYRMHLEASSLPVHHYPSLAAWFETLSVPIASNQVLIGLMEDVNDVHTSDAVLPAVPPVLQGIMTMPGMDNQAVRSSRIIASEVITLDQEVFGVQQAPVFINIRPENAS